jgi:hypothetical protein
MFVDEWAKRHRHNKVKDLEPTTWKQNIPSVIERAGNKK